MVSFKILVLFALFAAVRADPIHRQKTMDRIIGGHIVEPKYSRPYMVQITYERPGDKHECGGSILTRRHVLTAAHCIDKDQSIYKLKDYTVVTGEHDRRKDEGQETRHKIESKHYHPKTKELKIYDVDDRSWIYDFCILKLKDSISFNSNVKAVSLPDPQDTKFDKEGKPFIVMGWGHWQPNSPDAFMSPILMEKKVPWVTEKDCKEAYKVSGSGRKIDDSEICAGDLDKAAIDTCSGGGGDDSGGPLVWKDEESNKWKQIGVVSWGPPCGGAKSLEPGVYGKVTHVLPWIKKMINDGDGDHDEDDDKDDDDEDDNGDHDEDDDDDKDDDKDNEDDDEDEDNDDDDGDDNEDDNEDDNDDDDDDNDDKDGDDKDKDDDDGDHDEDDDDNKDKDNEDDDDDDDDDEDECNDDDKVNACYDDYDYALKDPRD